MTEYHPSLYVPSAADMHLYRWLPCMARMSDARLEALPATIYKLLSEKEGEPDCAMTPEDIRVAKARVESYGFYPPIIVKYSTLVQHINIMEEREKRREERLMIAKCKGVVTRAAMRREIIEQNKQTPNYIMMKSMGLVE